MIEQQIVNIANRLRKNAAEYPMRTAVSVPAGRSRGEIVYSRLTFAELEEESNRFANGLVETGLKRGQKVMLMVKPSLEFFTLTYSLFKIGAVPVMIDPGMGLRNLLHCVRQVEPDVFIGIPLAHVVRILNPRTFRSVKTNVTVGKRFWGGYSLPQLRSEKGDFDIADTEVDETAAILFTTGSTGPAKGVVYTHGIFDSQVEIIKREFDITPDDVDMPAFPLFGLFGSAMGMGVVIPEMDPTRPAKANPKKIREALESSKASFSFGSPALWDTCSKQYVKEGVTFPKLKRILMAGAPVPGYLHSRMLKKVLAEGSEIFTPYGATESLPVTIMRGSEVLKQTLSYTRNGDGVCVGRAIKEATVRIIRVVDGPLEQWSDDLVQDVETIGEIVVKSPVVTKEYYNLPEHTRMAKIHEGAEVWHRMGDVGYFDKQGRLWFCGRKAHRGVSGSTTLYSVKCEGVFNNHQDVFRSALVGVGKDRYHQTPVMIIEPIKGKFPKKRVDIENFITELIHLGQGFEVTKNIGIILFHKSFPVDIRHNAKIFREKLAVWADKKLNLPEKERK